MDSHASEATAVNADELGNVVGGDRPHANRTTSSTSTSTLEMQNGSKSGILPLPKGAMASPLTSPNPYRNGPADQIPPSTPRHLQFAEYRDNTTESFGPTKTYDASKKPWVPWPLRSYFWVPFVLVLALGAAGLEIALHFSKKNQGWSTKRDIGDETSVLHYVYTLPPVAIAAILVALWTWTDIEIKKMQPYVDLSHGDSPPHRSLFLDYTKTNNFIVWTNAAANRHYLVALASLMVVLSLTFQPLAAALFNVKDTWLQLPDVTLNNLGAIGLNQDLQFNDLTYFLTAAGFASASVLYRLADPPFVHGQYTIAPIQLPTDITANGTVVANTTAVKSLSGCLPADVQMTQRPAGDPNGPGWTNSASVGECAIAWLVDNSSTSLFGVDQPGCNSLPPPQFSPIVFWFFTYKPVPKASATFCFPTLEFWDVNVNIDLATSNLTLVNEIRQFSSSSNFSSLSANVTGAPLMGRAYNGISFNLTNPDRFVLERLNATRLQLPASVQQAAVQSPEGLVGSFDANRFVDLSTQVYTRYLALLARSVYFLPHSEPITLQVKTFKKRVWLSGTAVHLLAAAMLLLAFFASIVQLFHRSDRRRLRLQHQPGTIASAVSIGAQTGMGNLLAGRQNKKEMTEALSNKKFRIDVRTMKIVMEGEDGYETAASPTEGKKSVFAALQGQMGERRLSKRLGSFIRPSSSLPSTSQAKSN